MAENELTLEELTSFYESEQYQNMLVEFTNRSKREFGSRETDMFNLFFSLSYCQRRYMILDVPFSKVLSEIERNRDIFLDYQVSATDFFNEQEIDPTYLIEKFCEFYLLQTGDFRRLHYYLTIAKPSISFYPRKYAETITQLHKNAVIENVENKI
jgi:hypothetical protein